MKPKVVKIVVAVGLAGLVMAVSVGKAVANASAYEFTMNLRHVNGKKNNRPHTLDAGELTFSAQIWAHEKIARAPSSPLPVTIDVISDGLFREQVLCTLTVVPPTTLHQKQRSSKSCGRIKAGTYWIKASKDQDEGWHVQGSGTLTTR